MNKKMAFAGLVRETRTKAYDHESPGEQVPMY